jgi:hypothetical protein
MKALEKLVTQLMSAVQSAHTAKNEQDQEFYTNRSQQLDQQIDELVEKLYGLNEDEIEAIQINS